MEYKFRRRTEIVTEGFNNDMQIELDFFEAINFPQNGVKNCLGDLIIDLIIYDKTKDMPDSEKEMRDAIEIAVWDLYEELRMEHLCHILECRGLELIEVKDGE